MLFPEKIYVLRRRMGLSQEALAERLGVSRQAVSKWETGESEPEISKLRRLAEVLGVSADWLLSDEEMPEDDAREAESAPSGSNWLESAPGVIGTLLRRYGWLLGVYIAVGGGFITLIGAVAKAAAGSMSSTFDRLGGSMGGVFFQAPAGNVLQSGLGGGMTNPVDIVATVMIVLGLALLAGGTVLAVVLKRKSK